MKRAEWTSENKFFKIYHKKTINIILLSQTIEGISRKELD